MSSPKRRHSAWRGTYVRHRIAHRQLYAARALWIHQGSFAARIVNDVFHNESGRHWEAHMGSISRHPAIAIIAAATVAACSDAATTATTASPTIGVGPVRPELGTIQHIVIIMQENRSFDHYFGTFPGADGIPMSAGGQRLCVNDPASGLCVKPFHDANDKNHRGGPHGQTNAADIGGGKMNGFIGEAEKA